jgi:hypothetical protein
MRQDWQKADGGQICYRAAVIRDGFQSSAAGNLPERGNFSTRIRSVMQLLSDWGDYLPSSGPHCRDTNQSSAQQNSYLAEFSLLTANRGLRWATGTHAFWQS